MLSGTVRLIGDSYFNQCCDIEIGCESLKNVKYHTWFLLIRRLFGQVVAVNDRSRVIWVNKNNLCNLYKQNHQQFGLTNAQIIDILNAHKAKKSGSSENDKMMISSIKIPQLSEEFSATVNNLNSAILKHSNNEIIDFGQMQQEYLKLHNYYEHLAKTDETALETFKPFYDRIDQKIREMNFKSNVVTHVDLISLKSFFTPPIERIFVDPETGIRYLNGDHSKLLKGCGDFLGQMGLKGITGAGMCRRRKIKGQLCDLVYMGKSQELVEYQKGSWTFSNLYNQVFHKNEVEAKIIQIESLRKELQKTIQPFAEHAGYESFILLITKQDFIDAEFNGDFTRFFGIAFLLKKEKDHISSQLKIETNIL
jgi:hypothetical protein